MLQSVMRAMLVLTLLACAAHAAAQPPADKVLAVLDDYIGHWRSDTKTSQTGESLHFEYRLEWLDAGRTIAAMLIERVDSDGARSVVFRGFKGREPTGDSVYYFAASPSGRGARGTVLQEEDLLVTRYEGWTADGAIVEIRDEFHAVEDGEFVSETWLRVSPQNSWSQVGQDHWSLIVNPG